MPNTFLAVLHLPVPVTFASSHPLAESVELLRAATVPPDFDADSSEAVMGTVTPDHVRLERNQPWPRNQFLRPHFVGTFEQGQHRVVLTGQFAADRHTRFFVGTSVRWLTPFSSGHALSAGCCVAVCVHRTGALKSAWKRAMADALGGGRAWLYTMIAFP